MKPLLLLSVFLGVLMTGCSTVSSRIEQKSAVFNSLDAPTQERLKKSVVAIGDTTDMVYIALGRPDRIRERATSTGHHQTWIYSFHWEEYEGSHFGYRREAYFNPRSRSWHVYYDPVHLDTFRDREEEYMRVSFQGDKVFAIEQTKG